MDLSFQLFRVGATQHIYKCGPSLFNKARPNLRDEVFLTPILREELVVAERAVLVEARCEGLRRLRDEMVAVSPFRRDVVLRLVRFHGVQNSTLPIR